MGLGKPERRVTTLPPSPHTIFINTRGVPRSPPGGMILPNLPRRPTRPRLGAATITKLKKMWREPSKHTTERMLHARQARRISQAASVPTSGSAENKKQRARQRNRLARLHRRQMSQARALE